MIGPFLIVIVAAAIAFGGQAAVYERMIRILIADRDRVRRESAVYLGLLCPATRRVEAEAGDVAKPQGSVSSGEGNKPTIAAPPGSASVRSTRKPAANPFYRPKRVPFRKFFNDVRKLTNTPQQKTDALAEAISIARESQKKPQEKTHVS